MQPNSVRRLSPAAQEGRSCGRRGAAPDPPLVAGKRAQRRRGCAPGATGAPLLVSRVGRAEWQATLGRITGEHRLASLHREAMAVVTARAVAIEHPGFQRVVVPAHRGRLVGPPVAVVTFPIPAASIQASQASSAANAGA